MDDISKDENIETAMQKQSRVFHIMYLQSKSWECLFALQKVATTKIFIRGSTLHEELFVDGAQGGSIDHSSRCNKGGRSLTSKKLQGSLYRRVLKAPRPTRASPTHHITPREKGYVCPRTLRPLLLLADGHALQEMKTLSFKEAKKEELSITSQQSLASFISLH